MTTTTIAPLRDLPLGLKLGRGSHMSPDEGLCLLEAVAYTAGEPHSDSPSCASPVLAAIGRRLNDRFDDDERQLLAPMTRLLVGTRASLEVDCRRSYAMIDASIREIAPMGLDAVGWGDLAMQLRNIAPIIDTASVRAAQRVTEAVRNKARIRSSASASAAYYADAAADAAASAADAASAAADAAAAADASTTAYAVAAADASDAYYAAAAAVYNVYATASDADADAYAYAVADASAAAYASDAAYLAASAASAAADAYSTDERARIRSAARRPIVLATIAAFERAISVAA